MRTFGKMVLTFGMFAMMITAAHAQAQRPGGGRGFGGGFGGGGFGGGSALLTNKGVQQELKASDDQVSKLEALAQDMTEKQREQFSKLQDVPQDERREKMMALAQTANAEMNKSLAEILKPAQMKRFQQVQLQQAGLGAFAMPRVQEALKLTDDQKSKIRTINESQGESMREAFQGGQDDRAAMARKVAELRKQGTDKVLAVLTDEQKATWKELTGEPLEVRFEPRQRNQ